MIIVLGGENFTPEVLTTYLFATYQTLKYVAIHRPTTQETPLEQLIGALKPSVIITNKDDAETFRHDLRSATCPVQILRTSSCGAITSGYTWSKK